MLDGDEDNPGPHNPRPASLAACREDPARFLQVRRAPRPAP